MNNNKDKSKVVEMLIEKVKEKEDKYVNEWIEVVKAQEEILNRAQAEGLDIKRLTEKMKEKYETK